MLDRLLKLSAIFVLLIIGIAVLYSFVLLPNIKNKQEEKKNSQRFSLRTECLGNAKEKHIESWNEYCRIDNVEIGTDNSCLLDNERAEQLKKYFEDREDECYREYPVD